ncbi:helix-turn-helix domain-containing protein [Castellaniella ginsengisoli]|uniref:Helix-turn-helix domain-containing protein n=1 Tax=Castellaniella ginsengisoli TaxID=546114 RepID=A0AB39CI66_9BURK
MTQQHAAPNAGHHRPMNGATLKTIREALGLSVPWFADFCSVQERTVRHWESGRNTVPIKVGAAILTLEKASLELSDGIVNQIRTVGSPVK